MMKHALPCLLIQVLIFKNPTDKGNHSEIMKDSNRSTILGLMEENNFLAKLFNLDVLFDRTDNANKVTCY